MLALDATALYFQWYRCRELPIYRRGRDLFTEMEDFLIKKELGVREKIFAGHNSLLIEKNRPSVSLIMTNDDGVVVSLGFLLIL